MPQGQLFTKSSAVPTWALGNRNLRVEQVTTFEVGYKGMVAGDAFVSVDAYAGRLSDFITELTPGLNPAYGPWTAPAARRPSCSRSGTRAAPRNAAWR